VSTAAETLPLPKASRAKASDRSGSPALPKSPQGAVLGPWLRAQAVNVTRHAAALRPFKRAEFGSDAATPSEGHIRAVNNLITSLRHQLLKKTQRVTASAAVAAREPTPALLQDTMIRKERAHDWVRAIEKIWDFYFELFGQRQSRYAGWLLACDRIAMDCYQVAYTGIGIAKSIPAPPPFCYMRTGFAPATWRRGIPLRSLGKQLNPFPLIQLPYHRLVNPWTLAAVLHEVSHNLQSDLGLSQEIPRKVAARLLGAGAPDSVAALWARWNREMFSDVSAVLLGGPGMIGSVMDVVGRSPPLVFGFNPQGVHPTPYLRILINIEVLRRMGFDEEADHYRRAWTRIYPNPSAGNIPRAMLESFEDANRLAVDTVCFKPLQALGGKALADVYRFKQKEQRMIEEAARRLASGNDPGIVPERFLIGAARYALDHKLARPGVIAANFYAELQRR
jgi:hypothetical protein